MKKILLFLFLSAIFCLGQTHTVGTQFFSQGFNTTSSTWCPVDGTGADAQIYGYRIWDDNAKLFQIFLNNLTPTWTAMDLHINNRALSGGCLGTLMIVIYTFGAIPYWMSAAIGNGDPSPSLPGLTGSTVLGTTCSITSGTSTLTCLSALFTSFTTAEGPGISITGAGVSGATLTTYISTFTNSTTVTIATNASTTVSGTSTVTELGFGGGSQCAGSDYGCTPLSDITATGGGTDATFISMVSQIVTRYAGKIKYYEAYNEQDSPNFWCTVGSLTVCGGGNPDTTANVQSLQIAIRMNWDAYNVEKCLDSNSKTLSPSFHFNTALSWFHYYNISSISALALVGGTNNYLLSCLTILAQTVTGKMTYDYVNMHPRGGSAAYLTIGGNWNTANMILAYNNMLTEINNDNLLNLTIQFGDEFGYTSAVEGGSTVPAFTAYVMQDFTLGASMGFYSLYWYQWDSLSVGIGQLANGMAATGYDTLAHWLIGSTVGTYAASTGNGALVGNEYQVPVTSLTGKSELIVWDQTLSCNLTCTTANQSFGSQYTGYYDSTNTLHLTTGGNGTALVSGILILLVGLGIFLPGLSAIVVSF